MSLPKANPLLPLYVKQNEDGTLSYFQELPQHSVQENQPTLYVIPPRQASAPVQSTSQSPCCNSAQTLQESFVNTPVPASLKKQVTDANGVISFTINGQQHYASGVDPRTTLNDYIRNCPGLTGTKKSCAEGGCGACTVLLTWVDMYTGDEVNASINSCLAPLGAIQGKAVTTVEGLGNWQDGYNAIQKQLASCNGTQCGFCSPGWVMNMYSLLKVNPHPTRKEVEDHFDGNLCRCTGYRTILDAFKTFAVDYTPEDSACKSRAEYTGDIEEIESLSCSSSSRCSGGSGPNCKASCKEKKLKRKLDTQQFLLDHAQNPRRVTLMAPIDSSRVWVHPFSLSEVYSLIQQYSMNSRKLVVGNTSIGIYKDTANADVFIYIRDVEELNFTNSDSTQVSIGAAITISKLISFLESVVEANQGSYQVSNITAVIKHLYRVANWQVRNSACWAGNIMLAHDHRNFESDIFTVFMGVGATLTVGDSSTGVQTTYSCTDFINVDMSTSVLLSVQIPFATSANQHTETFKTALRHVNAHAFVNAAFTMEVDPSTYTITSQPILAYGGVLPYATRATQTETMLVGMAVNDINTLMSACQSLQAEMIPDPDPGTPEYRADLVLNYFYKFFLAVSPSTTSGTMSATQPFYRPISTGQMSYDTQPIEYPVSEAMPKVDAILQTSGEAQYIDDFPKMAGTLHASFVLSSTAVADIDTVDPSVALGMPGVVDFVSISDIPSGGTNNVEVNEFIPPEYHEPLFAKDKVHNYGQSIGLILADSAMYAEDAAKRGVSVTFKNVKEPILSVEQAVAANSFFPETFSQSITPISSGDVSTGFSQSDIVFNGICKGPMQYHFHLETHSCICAPVEDGSLKIHINTQWPSMVQKVVARVLNWPMHKISVSVPRLGGSYGAKITRSCIVAAAAAVACVKHNRPIRLIMDLNSNMDMQGKRHEILCEYQVGVNSDGKVQAASLTYYLNGGSTYDGTFTTANMALTTSDNCYYWPNFFASAKCCLTNIPTNTYMRGPGCLPAIFFMEHIMEHTAHMVNMDADYVRQLNFYQQGQTTPYGTPLTYWNIPTLWDQIQASADYQARKQAVDDYNAANKWTKRGISLVPMKYGIDWAGVKYGAIINVLQDGTVQVITGGCEVGQGLTTKVAQVAAYELGIDMSYIKVLQTDTVRIPNSASTGGSITSELCCQAVIGACQLLQTQMASAKAIAGDVSWDVLCNIGVATGVDMQARYWTAPSAPVQGPFQYNSYGVAITELHLDVLTGNTEVLRVDILFDCGTSLNPAIDLGQVEGGFVQGLGLYLSERIEYAPDGTLKTNGTWTYKPPSSKDIPIDFRASLLANAPNPSGVLNSKASGEPPMTLACSALFAAAHAINAARSDSGADYINIVNAPATVDIAERLCAVDYTNFTF